MAAITTLFIPGVGVVQQSHTLTGDIRVHRKFHSKILNNDRDVIVYLPPGYEDGQKKRYPVLYLNDGQNLFDGATSFILGQEWRVDETAQSLIAAGPIEPLIIVGINNTGKDRINEYTPMEDTKFKQGGKADLYGRLIVEELKPFIDANYMKRRDARHTGLGGSSLGGLVSLYQVRIWMDMGTKEGSTPEQDHQNLNDARLLQEALVKKGWKPGKDLKYFEAKGAEHNEKAWSARVESILKFLFPRKM